MKRTYRYAALALLILGHTNLSVAGITLLDSSTWKVILGGFVETDSITDTTRSFTEKVGNAPVLRPDNVNGKGGRSQMSIRNSRLSLTVLAPESNGWKSKGYLEFDLFGSTVSGSEASLYNNPNFRLRHGYFQTELNNWQFLAGQTWALFGWQPYYFMPTLQVSPVPGMLYSRTTQFRGTRNIDFSSDSHMQVALGLMRPPQRDSTFPGLETGFRFAFDGWSGGYVGGSSAPQKAQPLSIGVSYALRNFATPETPTSPTSDTKHLQGQALAVDFLAPIIPSKDKKDVGNTLTVGGEFTTGKGYGDQFDSWTGGMANPINTNASPATANTNLDAGIGGYDGTNSFRLVSLTTFNLYAQYHLPTSTRMWISGGYARLYSDNVASLKGTITGTAVYDKESVAFGNVMRDLSDQVRVGFEYSQVRTTYYDGTLARDNRFQLSAFFFF